jgi:hypothetical protein
LGGWLVAASIVPGDFGAAQVFLRAFALGYHGRLKPSGRLLFFLVEQVKVNCRLEQVKVNCRLSNWRNANGLQQIEGHFCLLDAIFGRVFWL